MKKLSLFLLGLVMLTCSTEDDSESATPNSQQSITEPVVTPITQFTLTMTASEGGNVTTGGTYDEGTDVPITATPSEGYEFVGWEGRGETTAELTITLNSDVSLNALFSALAQYTITVSALEGGTVSIEGGSYYEGTELTITASADEGYEFIGWSDGETSQIKNLIVSENSSITSQFLPLEFDVYSMSVIKFAEYNKDTLLGKKTVNLGDFYFPYLQWDFSGININEELDYLASDNFIVYWDKKYDHTNYAIDILRWSEFSAFKLIEAGSPKPKDYDTHRINIFIFRNDEFGIDLFEPDFGQAGHGDSNNRSFITYPFYNNFSEEAEINREYPTMNVLHEIGHIFQSSNNYLFDSRRWYRESTASYFESLFLADKRPGTLRFIADYLHSTHLRLWKDYNSSSRELQHLYGLELLFHYLTWQNEIDLSFIARSWNDSLSGETPLEYLIRKIPDFKQKFFDFSLRVAVLDFPFWVDKIDEAISQLINRPDTDIGQRHELILENSGTEGFYTPNNSVEGWGFSSIKIINSNNSNYDLEFISDFTEYRIGLVKENNNNFEYFELSYNDSFNLNENEIGYIVFTNFTNNYYGLDTYPFEFKVSKNPLSSTSRAASFSLDVSATSSSDYTLSGTDRTGNISGNDPDLVFNVGDTINFVANASGHPFYLKTTAGTGTGNTISGVTNNGAAVGTITWTPTSAGTFYYQCSLHGGMVGTITIQ